MNMRKKIPVIITITMLIVSSFFFTNLSNQKNDIKLELEKMELTIYKFDILGTESGKLKVKINLNTSGLSTVPSNIQVTQIDLDLYSNNSSIGKFYLPLNDSLDLANLHEFIILMDVGNGSSALVNKLLWIKNFDLDFIGYIHYKYIGTHILEFKNKLHFRLTQDKIKINLLDVDSVTNISLVNIINPFTTSMNISGQISFIKAGSINNVFALININDNLHVLSGNYNYSLPIDLNEPIQSLFDTMTNTNFTINLDIYAHINSISFHINTNYLLNNNDNLISFSLYKLNQLDINSTAKTVSINIDLIMNYTIPFTAELVNVTLNITTVSSTYLGKVSWESNQTLLLHGWHIYILYGISGVFYDVSISTILELSTSSAFIISSGIVFLKIEDNYIPLELHDYFIQF